MKNLYVVSLLAMTLLARTDILNAQGRAPADQSTFCTAEAAPGQKDNQSCRKQCKKKIQVKVLGPNGSIGRVKCGEFSVACRVENNSKCEDTLTLPDENKYNGACIVIATSTQPATATCTLVDP